MRCEKCGQNFPSKYYMATPTICRQCSEAQQAASSADSLSSGRRPESVNVSGVPLYCPICGQNEFFRKLGPALSGVDGDLTICICGDCGYVLLFKVDSQEGR